MFYYIKILCDLLLIMRFFDIILVYIYIGIHRVLRSYFISITKENEEISSFILSLFPSIDIIQESEQEEEEKKMFENSAINNIIHNDSSSFSISLSIDI